MAGARVTSPGNEPAFYTGLTGHKNSSNVGERSRERDFPCPGTPLLKLGVFLRSEPFTRDFPGSPIFRAPEKVRNSCKTGTEFILNRPNRAHIPGFYTGDAKVRSSGPFRWAISVFTKPWEVRMSQRGGSGNRAIVVRTEGPDRMPLSVPGRTTGSAIFFPVPFFRRPSCRILHYVR